MQIYFTRSKSFSFHSNEFLTKFGSNGRYIAAPTTNGKVFFWDVATKELTGVIQDYSGGTSLAFKTFLTS